jgi:transposase-like protein
MSKLKSLEELFGGRHFDREIIILCVRWYLRYKLGLRDLVEMMAERGLSLAHTTILRWVRRYTPEFVKRCHQASGPVTGGHHARRLCCLAPRGARDENRWPAA